MTRRTPSRVAPILAIAAFTAIAVVAMADLAHAQTAASAAATANTLNRAEAVSSTSTVKAVDVPNRKVTLVLEGGEEATLAVPPEYPNFAQLKPGDRIVATYVRETEIVISKAGQKTPEDAITTVEARAKDGSLPGGAVGGKITVTGAVTDIDRDKNVIKITSPAGGEVHTVAITRPDGREALKTLKVGDRITAHVTEAVLLETKPGG